MFSTSVLKPYMSNGEAVDPQSFTLVGGKDNEFEVESIAEYGPKTAHADGRLRKASELIFWANWRGRAAGTDAWQPYRNVKTTASEALKELALKHGLPADVFEKGSNKVPLPSIG